MFLKSGLFSTTRVEECLSHCETYPWAPVFPRSGRAALPSLTAQKSRSVSVRTSNYSWISSKIEKTDILSQFFLSLKNKSLPKINFLRESFVKHSLSSREKHSQHLSNPASMIIRWMKHPLSQVPSSLSICLPNVSHFDSLPKFKDQMAPNYLSPL